MGTIMTRGGAKTWWGEELPKHVAYLYKDHSHDDWTEVTYKQLLDKKRKKQYYELLGKRTHEKVMPAYIWVFRNNGSFFSGWYLYIKTRKEDYALNFRTPGMDPILKKVMSLFPCGVVPTKDNFDKWALNFCKQNPHVGFKRKKNQGLLMCNCRIDESGRLTDIWPINDKIVNANEQSLTVNSI